jgi:hypothetical protein
MLNVMVHAAVAAVCCLAAVVAAERIDGTRTDKVRSRCSAGPAALLTNHI